MGGAIFISSLYSWCCFISHTGVTCNYALGSVTGFLACEGTAPITAKTTRWYFTAQSSTEIRIFETSSKYIFNGQIDHLLNIREANASDEGTYRCEFWSDQAVVKDDSSLINFTVLSKLN